MLKRLWLCMKRDSEYLWFLVLVITTYFGVLLGGASIAAHFVNRPGETPQMAYVFIVLGLVLFATWVVIYGRYVRAIRRFRLQFAEEWPPITSEDQEYIERIIVAPRIKHAAEELNALYKEQGALRAAMSLDLPTRTRAARERLVDQVIQHQKKCFYAMLDTANSRLLPYPYNLRRDYKSWLA